MTLVTQSLLSVQPLAETGIARNRERPRWYYKIRPGSNINQSGILHPRVRTDPHALWPNVRLCPRRTSGGHPRTAEKCHRD